MSEKYKQVIVVFGYSKDRMLFEQAVRSLKRIVAKGQACGIRLYDDGNDPMYPKGSGVPDGVTRIETSWDRGGFRPGGFNESTVRGIVDSCIDACVSTGADWAVKTDCDASLNSLTDFQMLDPEVYGEFGNESVKGISMGVLHGFSRECLTRMKALMADRKAFARLVVQDKPEAPSTSLLASLTGMRRYLLASGKKTSGGWVKSRACFSDASPEQMDAMMRSLSVFFKPTIRDGTLQEKVDLIYTETLKRMTAFMNALEERGDRMAPDALTEADYDAAMEGYLREVRVERGYTTREPDDYFGSSNPRWAQDAKDWVAFRDAVMTYALNIINEYKATGNAPTLAEFKAGFPTMTWTVTEEPE